jgi:ficolin
MEADEGGWVVIMRRFNGSVDFNRTLEEYEFGFGDITGEFWYGLKNIHCLTKREPMQLRVEIGNGTEPMIVWEYQTFSVGTAPYYTLTIGTGRGTGDTYDALYQHRSQHFYAYDRDVAGLCAKTYGAGWWYIRRNSYSCRHYSNLNGKYEPAGAPAKNKLSWYTTTPGGYAHYTHVEMKVRPKSCAPCVV